jgi:hypothetical protein
MNLDMHAQQNVHLVHVFGDQAWVFMATIRQGLAAAMPLAQKAREQQQCRSQAMTPRLLGRAARWCTNKQLRAERVAALGLCMLGKFFYDNLACHQALGFAYGDKTRQVLEQTMLWNGQHTHDNNDTLDESKTFKQVCIQVENNHKCLPEGPPEAAPAAPAVQ